MDWFSSVPTPILSIILTNKLAYPYQNICGLVSKRWNQIVKSSKSNGTSIPKRPEKLLDSLSYHGDLRLVKWVVDYYSAKPTETTCILAATGGRLEILIWLKENGYQHQNGACFISAASRGHIEVLKWLKQNGCDCMHKLAIHRAHLELLE